MDRTIFLHVHEERGKGREVIPIYVQGIIYPGSHRSVRHKVTTSAMQIGVLALTVAMHFYSACARARERFEGGVTGGRQLDYARVQESSCCSYTFVMSGGVRLQTVKIWAKEVDIVGEWLRYDETSGFVTRAHFVHYS